MTYYFNEWFLVENMYSVIVQSRILIMKLLYVWFWNATTFNYSYTEIVPQHCRPTEYLFFDECKYLLIISYTRWITIDSFCNYRE